MSRPDDRPTTGDGLTAGQKPRMRETAVRDRSGRVNWSVTSRDFPAMPEMQRQLADERRARGERG
jgi:hypothetical protein